MDLTVTNNPVPNPFVPTQLQRIRQSVRYTEGLPWNPPSPVTPNDLSVMEQGYYAISNSGIPGGSQLLSTLTAYPVTVTIPSGGIDYIWQTTGTDANGNTWNPNTPWFSCGQGSAALFWLGVDDNGTPQFVPVEASVDNGDGTATITQQMITVTNWALTAIPAQLMMRVEQVGPLWCVVNVECPTS